MNKKEFLSQIPQNNTEWAAQQIATGFTGTHFQELEVTFNILGRALYKDWAKELTFSQIKEAIQLVKNLKK